MPAPFLGTALIGNGKMVGAVDSYGDVVDLRQLGPPGRALVQIPSGLQSAGTVPAELRDRRRAPIWAGQGFPSGARRAFIRPTCPGPTCCGRSPGSGAARRRSCAESAGRRRRARTGAGSPRHARSAAARRAGRVGCTGARCSSCALSPIPRTGAAIAGAREGWAYVWPRDAAAVAIALAAAGHRAEARRIVAFLEHLDLGAAARFEVTGAPVEGRGAQGDADGWVAAAARAVGTAAPAPATSWRGIADYQEKGPGDYLGNVLASTPSDAGSTVRAECGHSRWPASDGPGAAAGEPGLWA